MESCNLLFFGIFRFSLFSGVSRAETDLSRADRSEKHVREFENENVGAEEDDVAL